MNTLTSCGQPDTIHTPHKLQPEQPILNLPYGPHPRQVMDIHLPANASAQPTPALVLLHGGGWNTGSKADFTPELAEFKKRLPHVALFVINYRLVSGGFRFPAQEEDVKAAIDFIVAQQTRFCINPNKIALLGVSAGAHLALLQAYKQPLPQVKAVVSYFGPTDLTAMFQHPWHPLVPLALQMVTGTTPDAAPQVYKAASPVEFVTPLSAPTLLLHGAKDVVVNLSQSQRLAAALSAAKVPYQLEVFAAQGHGRWAAADMQQSYNQVEAFLKNYL